MVALIVVSPSSMLSQALAPWLPVLLMAALVVSAVLNVPLRRRPRVQRFVTAMALAFLLAMSYRAASQPRHVTRVHAPVIDCDIFWFMAECWFAK